MEEVLRFAETKTTAKHLPRGSRKQTARDGLMEKGKSTRASVLGSDVRNHLLPRYQFPPLELLRALSSARKHANRFV